jgi:hypothetical protein
MSLLLGAITTASTSGSARSAAGMPMLCTTRSPLPASVLARSEAPV